MAMELEYGLSYFDEHVNFGFEVEPMLPEDFLDGFVLVVSDKEEYPPVEVFFYHGVGIDLLYV